MSRLSTLFAMLSLAAVILAGCAAPSQLPPTTAVPTTQVLQAGDVVKLTFPGTPTMDTSQQIRRDGKLNLNLVGEVEAAGKTPAELEKELTAQYAKQLVSKEVNVTVVSSSFAVFVSGAVIRPGKVQPDRPITALEAIMEAGGFDYAKANTSAVVVIRTQGSHTENFTLDLKSVLDGKPSQPFYLQANDIVYVPQKFQWF